MQHVCKFLAWCCFILTPISMFGEWAAGGWLLLTVYGVFIVTSLISVGIVLWFMAEVLERLQVMAENSERQVQILEALTRRSVLPAAQRSDLPLLTATR